MSKTKGNVIDPLDVVHGATLEAAARARRQRQPRRPTAHQEHREDVPRGHPADGRRRAALHARRAGGAGAQHPPVDRARRGLSQLHQQAVERVALRADEPRRLRRRALRRRAARGRGDARRSTLRRSLDPVAAAARPPPRSTTALEAFRFNDAAQRDLPLRVGRAVRLVHRAGEAAPLRRRQRGRSAQKREARGAGRARDVARDDVPPAAPVRAVRHRGDLAEAAEADGHAGLAHDHDVPGGRSRR